VRWGQVRWGQVYVIHFEVAWARSRAGGVTPYDARDLPPGLRGEWVNHVLPVLLLTRQKVLQLSYQ
jgi:hypothetical protein